MQLPIKTEGPGAPSFALGGFEPVVKDRRTGELKVDEATGQVQFTVHVMVFVEHQEKPEIWSVRVIGEPKGLTKGQPVRILDLVASDWEFQSDQGLRHGISLRASAVQPMQAPSAKAA